MRRGAKRPRVFRGPALPRGAGYVRLSLALSDADLEEGADRLAAAVA